MKDVFKEFDRGTTIIVHVVFPGEYRIGFETNTHKYIPGSGSYYDFETALNEAIKAYRNLEASKDIVCICTWRDRQSTLGYSPNCPVNHLGVLNR